MRKSNLNLKKSDGDVESECSAYKEPQSNKDPFFIKRQFQEIRKGSLRSLLKKSIRLLHIICILPIIIGIRLIRPIILIRFGLLPSSRIGPFSTCPELYLCEREKGMHTVSIDFFGCHKEKISNQQLKKMWERILRMSTWTSLFVAANKLFPGYECHMVPMPNENDFGGLLAMSKPHLYFLDYENEIGYKMLADRGVSLKKKFICLAARDSKYLSITHPEINWNYHDYRDANIDHYIPVAKELANRNFTVFRMGVFVNKKLNIEHPLIIDYALKFRDDFLDIFLLSKCHFFFGALSGINSVSMIFRRPKAVTDVISLHSVHTWMPDDLFIPKKLWIKKESRFMTFQEQIESGAWMFLNGQQYVDYGLEIFDNTPEEITALAIEMDERLNGTWIKTDEDESLQNRFWEIFNQDQSHGKTVSRIGAEFLRQNQELLM